MVVSSGVEEALKHWEGVEDWEGVKPEDGDAPSVPLLDCEGVVEPEGEGDTDPVPVPPTQVVLGQPLLVMDTVEVFEAMGDMDRELLPLGEREGEELLVQEVVTHREMEVVEDTVGVTGVLKDIPEEGVRGEGELLGLPDRVTETHPVGD